MDNETKHSIGNFKMRYSHISVVLTVFCLSVLLVISGCDTFMGDIQGEIDENQAPSVEFSNVPAWGDTFQFAPVIYWKGSDPDGFVENYYYADIVDSSAIAQPDYFTDFIDESEWVETEATQDTVYLLTESGEITEHVFYLKAVDELGKESPVIFRRFFRSNEPPNVPLIKWFTAADSNFAHDVVLEDTFYVLDKITDTWPGLGFTWKSSDPDDRDLYTIPLEFRYYLEKAPHDTVWQWTSRDWSNDQDLVIAGLETGHYKLTVWARDDGFEESVRPASITFDVYEPSFEKSILMLNATYENENFNENQRGLGNVLPGTQIGEFYQSLLSQVGNIYPDYEYRHYGEGEGEIKSLYKSYLGQFRLVILTSENRTAPSGVALEDSLRQYLRVGGRLWVLGNFVPRNLLTNSEDILGLAESSFGSKASVPANEAEFISANHAVNDLPDLKIDTSKSADTWRRFWFDNQGNPRYKVYPLLPGVDWIIAGSNAETAYYFNSYTDTASGDVWNDSARVVSNIGTIYYPPTPLDCLIKLKKKRVQSISRIENVTRGEFGEVIALTNNVGTEGETVVRVSYESGEPWALDDVIITDYVYSPDSDFHFKPCGVRYERLTSLEGGGFEVRYRIAAFGFPLYYLDNSDGSVSEMFANMLTWFFWSSAH